MNAFRFVASLILWACASAASGQNFLYPPPHNVVQLSATAAVDARQDMLTLTLATTREGSDPAAVQGELKSALDAALTEAKKSGEPGQLDVHTGNFSLHPRHGKDGRISIWQGRAELVLEGRDFARISALAGRIQTLTVASAGFSLSREQRAKAESEAQSMAIEDYKGKADEIARRFGFSGYSLREISINANDRYPQPRQRTMAMEARSSYAEPVPVEAGNSTVTVTVSGEVQLK